MVLTVHCRRQTNMSVKNNVPSAIIQVYAILSGGKDGPVRKNNIYKAKIFFKTIT